MCISSRSCTKSQLGVWPTSVRPGPNLGHFAWEASVLLIHYPAAMETCKLQNIHVTYLEEISDYEEFVIQKSRKTKRPFSSYSHLLKQWNRSVIRLYNIRRFCLAMSIAMIFYKYILMNIALMSSYGYDDFKWKQGKTVVP